MISTLDKRQLETLQQVAALLDLLRDPAAFKAIVENAAATAARLEKVVAAVTTIEKAEEYLRDAQAKQAKMEIEAEEAGKKAAGIISSAHAEKEKQELAIAESKQHLADEWAEVRKAKQKAVEDEKAAAALLAKAEKRATEIDARERVLVAGEKRLQSRVSQIESLARG